MWYVSITIFKYFKIIEKQLITWYNQLKGGAILNKAKLKKAKRKVQRLGALWVPELVGPSGAADIAAGFKTTEMGDTLFFL